MFAVVGMEAMLNFTVPLYIQIVQGQTPLATAIAMMPFNLTVFFTAILVVRLYDKLTPRQIGRAGFASAPWPCSGSPSSCATTGVRCRCWSASSPSASARERWSPWSSTSW
jgi:hypothetical protein